MTVCAATKWPTNADMIVDIVELGYIKPTDKVCDLTFGGGKWWSIYDHTTLGAFIAVFEPSFGVDVTDYGTVTIIHADWRKETPIPADSVDVVVFDPPYVAMGGRKTSTLPDFMDRYGLKNCAVTPELLQADNELGLREAMRITKPGGLILAKCAPYISSGVRKDGDWWARDAALAMGLTIEDMLIHVGDVRAQPKDGPCRECKGTGAFSIPNCRCDAGKMGANDDAPIEEHTHGYPCEKCDGTGRIPRKVKHARNNYSVCFVFKKPKPRKPRKKVAK